MTAPELNRELRLEYIEGFKAFVNFSRDVSQTESVFDMAEGFNHTESYKLSMEYLKSHPDIGPLIQERYLGPTPDIEALIKLPENSLGYIYASEMKEANFDPEFYRKVKVENDDSYVTLRLRQTHDIWHKVTGFGVDTAEELGLQAFTLAQTRIPLSVALIAGGMLNTLLKQPDNLPEVMNSINLGYNMGLEAKPFLAQKWEENWEKSLSEWRVQLGVEPV